MESGQGGNLFLSGAGNGKLAAANRRKVTVSDLSRMAICVAFCCVSAYLSVPMPLVPGGMLTALTVALNLMALMLSPWQTFLGILVYVLLGCVGLPVFVGGSSGVARLFGPTGGFIFAWLLAYPLVSLAKGKSPRFARYAGASLLLALPISYAGGMASMMLVMEVDFWQAFWMGIVPYLPGDVLKCVFAAFLAVRIRRALGKY